MPVELRKRKAPALPPEPPAKKSSKAAKAAAKAKQAVTGKPSEKSIEANGSASAAKSASKPAKGDTITLEGFGGEIETNDGKKTTLEALVDESKAGVVLFTYPKASTPGCKN
jgi:peroxiredoxin Q/BCP